MLNNATVTRGDKAKVAVEAKVLGVTATPILDRQAQEKREAAKQANEARRDMLTSVSASQDQIRRVCDAFVTSTARITSLEAQLGKAKQSQITVLREACNGLAPVTEDAWDRTWKPALETMMTGYKTVQSRNVAISNLKVAVLALTNNIMPDEDDNTLTKFIRSARPKIKAAGVMKETGKGRKGEGEAKKIEVKLTARQQALRLLAQTANEDEDTIRARTSALDYILKQHSWDEIIKLANQLAKK